MTPEERDRLVRLEERVQNLADDNRELRDLVKQMAEALKKLSDAFTIATSFGKGSMWTIMKLAGFIAIGITVLQWLSNKMEFFK